jgi:hypothetical protein
VYTCRLPSRYEDIPDFFLQRAGSDDGVANSLLKDSHLCLEAINVSLGNVGSGFVLESTLRKNVIKSLEHTHTRARARIYCDHILLGLQRYGWGKKGLCNEKLCYIISRRHEIE